MTQKRANPAPLAADRARKPNCVSDYSDQNRQLQELRVRFLARRFDISPDLAILIATIAMGEVSV